MLLDPVSLSTPSTKKTKVSQKYRISKNAKLDVADFLDGGDRGDFRVLVNVFDFCLLFRS